MTQFVLVATQRSGTNFFRSVINQHPQIHCCNELFLDDGWCDQQDNFYHFWLQRISAEPQLITSRGSATAIAGFMTAVYAAYARFNAVGIDIKYTELDRLFHLSNVILARKWKTIHIVRRNVLKAQISHFLLNVNKGRLAPKDYKNCMTATGEKRVRLKLNEALISLLQQASGLTDRWRRRFAMGPYLEIAYEDFFAPGKSQGSTITAPLMHDVFDFLGVSHVPPEKLVSSRKKGNPSNLTELIENYDAVAEFLQPTAWNHCLQ